MDQVEACATEIADYLNDLANWEQPIFPQVQECSNLEVEPPYFNTTGTFWQCDSQGKEGTS